MTFLLWSLLIKMQVSQPRTLHHTHPPEYCPSFGRRWTRTWSRSPGSTRWRTLYPFCRRCTFPGPINAIHFSGLVSIQQATSAQYVMLWFKTKFHVLRNVSTKVPIKWGHYVVNLYYLLKSQHTAPIRLHFRSSGRFDRGPTTYEINMIQSAYLRMFYIDVQNI